MSLPRLCFPPVVETESSQTTVIFLSSVLLPEGEGDGETNRKKVYYH